MLLQRFSWLTRNSRPCFPSTSTIAHILLNLNSYRYFVLIQVCLRNEQSSVVLACQQIHFELHQNPASKLSLVFSHRVSKMSQISSWYHCSGALTLVCDNLAWWVTQISIFLTVSSNWTFTKTQNGFSHRPASVYVATEIQAYKNRAMVMFSSVPQLALRHTKSQVFNGCQHILWLWPYSYIGLTSSCHFYALTCWDLQMERESR